MFRIIYVSVNGGKYLEGASSVASVDKLDKVPDGVGTEYPSIDAVQKHVPREYRGLSCYWRVEIVNAEGAIVMRGTRSGPGGTGERWTWQEVKTARS